MATTEKARMISLRIAEALKVRCSPLAVTESIGTSGDPVISVGPGTNGGANAIIRVVPITASLAKDVLGNASKVNATHVVQLATEANYAGASDNIADPMTRQQLGNVIVEVFGAGATVEWYDETAGTAPTEATITSNKLKATIPVSGYWPLAGQ